MPKPCSQTKAEATAGSAFLPPSAKQIALELLKSRLQQRAESAISSTRAADRKHQVGLGQRGDKRGTIRIQDGTVKDHVTGKVWRYEDYAAGII